MNSHRLKVNVTLAREVMVAGVKTLLPSTPIPVALHKLISQQFTEMPIVTDTGEYCGMFSEKCCMRILSRLAELVDVHHQVPMDAAQIMIPYRELRAVSPTDNVHTAMQMLLNNKHCSAPVVDSKGHFLGFFSERTCLSFIIEAAYGGLPSATVSDFVDSTSNHLITPQSDLHSIAKIFVRTSFGRLPVMQGDKLIGQVSRRDVLKNSQVLSSILKSQLQPDENDIEQPDSIPESFLVQRDSLLDHSVSEFADEHSHPISPDMNLFSIAQLCFTSPFRRFPVLENKRLIGQVTRSDVLRSALKVLD